MNIFQKFKKDKKYRMINGLDYSRGIWIIDSNENDEIGDNNVQNNKQTEKR